MHNEKMTDIVRTVNVAAKTKKKVGRPSKPSRQPFFLRLDPALHKALRHYALDQGRPLNDILVEVINAWWDERQASDSL